MNDKFAVMENLIGWRHGFKRITDSCFFHSSRVRGKVHKNVLIILKSIAHKGSYWFGVHPQHLDKIKSHSTNSKLDTFAFMCGDRTVVLPADFVIANLANFPLTRKKPKHWNLHFVEKGEKIFLRSNKGMTDATRFVQQSPDAFMRDRPSF